MKQIVFKNSSFSTINIDQARISIGREPGNHVVLNDNTVSGYHAEIHFINNELSLIDLGSTNGTLCNGKKILKKTKISLWDTISFGQVEAEIVDQNQRRPTVITKAVGKNTMAASKAHLLGLPGKMNGQKYELSKNEMTIGRNPSNDICIEDPLVSGQHARLTKSGSGWTLTDQNSTNGTFVNGKKISEQQIFSGDTIKFDQVEFSFISPGSENTSKTDVRPILKDDTSKTGVRKGIGTTTQLVSTIETSGASITICEGADPASFPFKQQHITLGRGDDNDIIIDDPTVSKHHLEFHYQDGVWNVKDTGSANGCFLNGKKIDTGTLASEDMIRLGKIAVRFKEQKKEKSPGSQTQLHAVPPQKKNTSWIAACLILIIVAAGAAGFYFYQQQQGVEDAPLQAWKVWEQFVPNSKIYATPLLADINGNGVTDVTVADSNGFVWSFDGSKGKEVFKIHTDGKIVASLAGQDITGDGVQDVSVCNALGIVTIINGNGKIVWKSNIDFDLGPISNRAVYSDLNQDDFPDLIVPSEDKGLVALDGKRGWALWNTENMMQGSAFVMPLVYDVNDDDQKDYVTATDAGQVIAFSANGERVWKLWEAFVDKVSYASPLIMDDVENPLVIVASATGQVTAFIASNGRIAWQTELNQSFFASPVAADANQDKIKDIVLTAENGNIYILDSLTGDEIWSRALGRNIKATPALHDFNNDNMDDIVVATETGDVFIIDMFRGRDLLAFEVEHSEGYVASPLIGDVDGDGLLDISLASTNGMVSVLGLNRSIKKAGPDVCAFLEDGK